jgi:hypothetical protein
MVSACNDRGAFEMQQSRKELAVVMAAASDSRGGHPPPM